MTQLLFAGRGLEYLNGFIECRQQVPVAAGTRSILQKHRICHAKLSSLTTLEDAECLMAMEALRVAYN